MALRRTPTVQWPRARSVGQGGCWSELGRTIALPTRNASIFGPNVSPILYYLDAEQRERYLLPVIRGEKKACFAQTEADAGGDPGSMRTTAVRDGGDYVINGTKRFITGADEADFAQVFAVTDPEKGSRGGISGFLVDMDTSGVKLLRAQEMVMDDRPWEIALVAAMAQTIWARAQGPWACPLAYPVCYGMSSALCPMALSDKTRVNLRKPNQF